MIFYIWHFILGEYEVKKQIFFVFFMGSGFGVNLFVYSNANSFEILKAGNLMYIWWADSSSMC